LSGCPTPGVIPCGEGHTRSGAIAADGRTFTLTETLCFPFPMAPRGCGCILFVDSGSRCGNDVLDTGERCDDGNILNGDGCSIDCEAELCGRTVRSHARARRCPRRQSQSVYPGR
jgi:cysteine-rich repeat protein